MVVAGYLLPLVLHLVPHRPGKLGLDLARAALHLWRRRQLVRHLFVLGARLSCEQVFLRADFLRRNVREERAFFQALCGGEVVILLETTTVPGQP